MSSQLIKSLITHLPRYAEEEGDFYAVKREDLINVLCSEYVNRAVAENTINFIENLLDTLAVLNTDYLQQGEWCFISFPAQLLALSVLTAMSDKESRLLADNFWNTQGISDDKKNKQRDLLRAIETNRVEYHESHNAPPIRYIYVAWSIIKLDDKVLFYQREESQKQFDKTAGDYGLIGGRLNQRDMPNFSVNKQRCLQAVQSNDASIKAVLPETLKRELSEEAGLIFDKHYRFTLWRELTPYRQVQGSAPNHAFTEYYLSIFHIELTLAGYLFLQQKINADNRLVWFSMADIENGATADGKIAYIKALFHEFANNRAALIAELTALPNSFASGYLFNREKYGLTLLQDTDKPLLAGVLGKEKVLDVVLTARQQAILLGLAAHNRGFEFSALIDNIIFHPYGWIELENNSVLKDELIELAVLLQATDFKIENQQDRFFRLSVNPAMVYFDARLFIYTVQRVDLNSRKSKIPIIITRADIPTALGLLMGKSETFVITRTLARNLHKLTEQQGDNDGKAIEDNYKKTLHDKLSVLGLKGLLRQEDKCIKFCAVYQVN